MKSQIDRERDEKAAQPVPPGDLKASDFFPPGTGWNQDASKRGDADPQDRKPSDGDLQRH